MKIFGLNMGDIHTPGKLWQPARNDLIVWGMMGLLVFFMALLLWDGFIFYQSVVNQKNFPEPPYESIGISVSRVDEVVKKLDERQARFNEALSK